MGWRKYLVLIAVMTFGGTGDVLLARGMKSLGPVSWHDWPQVFTAIFNPWVAAGIVCLIAFFAAYSHALSWADLTYVLPATSFGYVWIALLSRFFLHEHISGYRWAGIFLIAGGVALVTRGPALTEREISGAAALAGAEPAAGARLHDAAPSGKASPLAEDGARNGAAPLGEAPLAERKRQHELA